MLGRNAFEEFQRDLFNMSQEAYKTQYRLWRLEKLFTEQKLAFNQSAHRALIRRSDLILLLEGQIADIKAELDDEESSSS